MNDQNHLLAALRWQIEAGIDVTVGQAALDRFADSSKTMPKLAEADAKVFTPAPPPPSPPKAPLTQFEPGAPLLGGAMAGLPAAQEAATAAASIPELVQAIEAFEGCELKKTARSTVVLDGNPAAQVLLVGEGPGAEDDATGTPLAGPAGDLLDKMLAAIGLRRETHVLICNSVFWRPLGNRAPNDGELTVCRPFLARLIQLQQPKIIVTMGGSSTKSLLSIPGIVRARGKWVDYQNDKDAAIPALPMLHPSFLLRQATAKREAWQDLRALNAKMEELL